MILLNLKVDGFLNGKVLGVTLSQREEKIVSLRKIADFFGFPCVFYANQTHSGKTLVWGDSIAGEDGDAVLCFEKNVILGVFTADCVPIYLFSDKFCGIIHAGWRGFVNGIFESFFSKLEERQTNIDSVKAVIGACICGQCYEVGYDVAEKFPSNFITRKNGKIYLDLKGFASDKLLKSGLKRENIVITPYCTFHHSGWFNSYRRNKTEFRNVNYLGIK